MAISDRQLLNALSRTPFIDSTDLALILGEPHATVHRVLANLLAEGNVGRVSHGTAPPAVEPEVPRDSPGHQRSRPCTRLRDTLGLRAGLPLSREWLTLLIRRMDAVASIYRLAASMSPGIDGLRTRVEFHRRGRFDAAITLHDGRSFGVVRPGAGPAAEVALGPVEGHSAVQLRAASRHRTDPCAERMGASADGEVLHQQRPP